MHNWKMPSNSKWQSDEMLIKTIRKNKRVNITITPQEKLEIDLQF
jgi:putative sterol carrier protein